MNTIKQVIGLLIMGMNIYCAIMNFKQGDIGIACMVSIPCAVLMLIGVVEATVIGFKNREF